jgi:signal transduction histidine kinase
MAVLSDNARDRRLRPRAVPVTARALPAPSELPSLYDDDLQLVKVQLRRSSLLGAGITAFIALAALGVGLVGGEPRLVGLASLLAVHVPVGLYAARLARRGETEASVTLPSISTLLVVSAALTFYPPLRLGAALVPALVMVAALPYVTGRRLVMLLAAATVSQLATALALLLPQSTQADGRHPVLVVLSYMATGVMLGFLIYTSAHRLRATLRRERTARDAAQRAVHARDVFIDVAGHELRSPLSTLKLQLNRLHELSVRGGVIDARALAQPLESTQRQIDRLSRLVKDLLDASHLEQGHVSLDLRPLDVAGLLRDLGERLAPMDGKPPLHVRVETKARAVGDLDRVERVVSNLVTNAFKYGGGSDVELSAREHEGMLRIEVRDEGPGIAPEAQAQIFERYERAGAGETTDGLGLGLWICRRLVEEMNGRIGVHSALGEGATFWVELPRAPELVHAVPEPR